MSPAVVPYQVMERAQIQPSPLNPRKHFDEAKLAELAGSMGHGVGIVEPLVVRPRPELNCYELVAGERRWRAAAIAGLDQVPVVVKELSDAQVLEIMVIENNQREDISPLEEADGFRQLLKIGKFDADSLAERLGRSRKYVYDRIKLLDLSPLGQRLLADGRITAGHGILLARLKAKDQQRALDPSSDAVFEDEHERLEPGIRGGGRVMRFARSRDAKADVYDGLKARSVRELETWIAEHVRFDVAHMAAQAPLEFGEVGHAVARAQATPGRGKRVVAITFDYRTPDATRDPKERTFGVNGWKRADGQADSKTCEYAVLGVVAGGPGYGQAFDVCVARDRCLVHWKQDVAEKRRREKARSGGDAKSAAATAKARQEADRRRYEEQQRREEEQRKAWDKARPELLAACAAKVKGLKLEALVGILVEGYHRAEFATALELLGAGIKPSTPEVALQALALRAFVDDARGNYGHARDTFTRTAKKELGVDVAAILRKVQTSAPAKKADAKGKRPAKKARAA